MRNGEASSRQDRWVRISDCAEVGAPVDQLGLTFDLDWACDAVIEDTIDLVDASGLPATWFVTHDTPLLERLRSNPRYELGIHPNFNPFLHGKQERPIASVLDELLAIVPEAKSVRSHSMVQSSRLMDLFAKRGLRFDCNHFVPEQSLIELRPWKLWNGLIKVPHFWEDDATCLYEENTPIQSLVQRRGLKIFDFHPIHVYLNTEDLARYEDSRPFHSDAERLRRYRYDGTGTRTFLLQLLELR